MKESNAQLTENTEYHQSPRNYLVNDMADEFETYSIAHDEFTVQSDITNPFNSQNESDQLQFGSDFEKTMFSPTESDTAAIKFNLDILIVQMCEDEYDRLVSQTERELLEQMNENNQGEMREFFWHVAHEVNSVRWVRSIFMWKSLLFEMVYYIVWTFATQYLS